MIQTRRIKLAYSGSNIVYKGVHINTLAEDDDPNWTITKYSYDGTNIDDIQVATGTWTDRATYF